MFVDKIVDSIQKVMDVVRLPAKEVPGILLVCSMVRRPGLSLLTSLANVSRDFNRLGIPTEKNPDGSENLSISYAATMLKEVIRAIQNDMKITNATVPGSEIIATPMGPGTNVNTGKSYGLAQ